MLQAAEEEEARRNNRPNFAMSEDMTVPRGAPSAAPGGAKRAPLKELSRAESILSTQSTRRNYAYSLEAAPDALPTRKHLNTFSVSKKAHSTLCPSYAFVFVNTDGRWGPYYPGGM